MKQKYQRVVLEIVELDKTDVIRTSGGDNFGSVNEGWFTMQSVSEDEE